MIDDARPTYLRSCRAPLLLWMEHRIHGVRRRWPRALAQHPQPILDWRRALALFQQIHPLRALLNVDPQSVFASAENVEVNKPQGEDVTGLLVAHPRLHLRGLPALRANARCGDVPPTRAAAMVHDLGEFQVGELHLELR